MGDRTWSPPVATRSLSQVFPDRLGSDSDWRGEQPVDPTLQTHARRRDQLQPGRRARPLVRGGLPARRRRGDRPAARDAAVSHPHRGDGPSDCVSWRVLGLARLPCVCPVPRPSPGNGDPGLARGRARVPGPVRPRDTAGGLRLAGLGDIAIGVTAPWVALALLRQPGFAISRVFVVWNLLGILDLVVAVSVGGLSSAFASGAPGEVTTGPMAQLPLVLIPAYLVPLFLILHLAALFQARRQASSMV